MLMIAQREEGRLKQEVRKLEKELEEFKEKKNVFEVLFFNFMVLYYGKAYKYYNYLIHNLVCQKLIQYINIDCKQICCTADWFLWKKFYFSEQHIQANTEVGGDEIPDELGPAGFGGMAGRVSKEGWGLHGHSEIHSTRWKQNQGQCFIA